MIFSGPHSAPARLAIEHTLHARRVLHTRFFFVFFLPRGAAAVFTAAQEINGALGAHDSDGTGGGATATRTSGFPEFSSLPTGKGFIYFSGTARRPGEKKSSFAMRD